MNLTKPPNKTPAKPPPPPTKTGKRPPPPIPHNPRRLINIRLRRTADHIARHHLPNPHALRRLLLRNHSSKHIPLRKNPHHPPAAILHHQRPDLPIVHRMRRLQHRRHRRNRINVTSLVGNDVHH